MSLARLPITYNLLVKATGGGHYVKAGQWTAPGAPHEKAEIELTLDGRALHGVIDQVYTPPGCDEHCIGTLFISEA